MCVTTDAAALAKLKPLVTHALALREIGAPAHVAAHDTQAVTTPSNHCTRMPRRDLRCVIHHGTFTAWRGESNRSSPCIRMRIDAQTYDSNES